MDEILNYTGEKLKNGYNTELDPYIANHELVDAVNLAIYLKRPILLMGDPGCGKTRLAESVAFEIHEENYKEFFFRWDIKSTTKAKDGLYTYDAIDRLRDAQLKEPKSKNPGEYITLAAMGEAFKKSTAKERAILLIDEVDKAGIDFPNDLLLELDKGEYYIEETKERVDSKYMPIIIITSNAEKELPSAFLRRCIFHHISFPTKDQLMEILDKNFTSKNHELVEKVVDAFLKVRKEMETRLARTEKKVSTSELIDWFRVINHCYELKNSSKTLTKDENRLVEQLRLLENESIPFRQVLLKDYEAHMAILPDR